jgi:hypothetical protein
MLLNSWPKEPYDPDFAGQDVETYYLDTPSFAFRKARKGCEHYLTLRARCYGNDAYALSAKTEDAKFRVAISSTSAAAILVGNFETIAKLLPADLLAGLLELARQHAGKARRLRQVPPLRRRRRPGPLDARLQHPHRQRQNHAARRAGVQDHRTRPAARATCGVEATADQAQQISMGDGRVVPLAISSEIISKSGGINISTRKTSPP